VSENVRVDSLLTDHFPPELKEQGTPLFDSVEALAGAVATFANDEGRVGSEWNERHLVDPRVMEGKFPLGPGWRILDAGWSGLALSRERAAGEYQIVNVLHTDRAGTVSAEFDRPTGVKRLYALFGAPEYLRIENQFELPPLALRAGDRELARFDPADGLSGWVLQEVDLSATEPRDRLAVSMTSTDDRPAVGCFRLMGFE
jgi:hypothetical protein